MKFVDISGFGHSGKSVVTDLLSEFKGYQVPHYNFEFNLLRIQGGLIDLKAALHDNWSPIRSDAAVRRFFKLVKRIGPPASFANPASLFYSNGMNYDVYFDNRFTPCSLEYIRSLINYEYLGEWPFPIIEEPPYKQFWQRLLQKTRIKSSFNIPVYFAAPGNFMGATINYLHELFSGGLKDENHTMVLHNAVEPFHPVPALDLLGDAKVIVVQRDPRDIFASSVTQEGYNPSFEIKSHWRLKQSFLNVDNVEIFIERQMLQYNKVNTQADDSRVLRLRFEDVVLKYEESVERILAFLGEEPVIHIHKGKRFNPANSAKNVGLWKTTHAQKQIARIEEAMGSYCYNN